MINRYFYIQHMGKGVRLLTPDSEDGYVTIEFGHGQSLTFNTYLERELCTMVYTPSYSQLLAKSLNEWCDGLGADEIADFYAQFRARYPLRTLRRTLKDIRPKTIHFCNTMIATKDESCELQEDMLKYHVKLTYDQEMNLLNFIATRRLYWYNPGVSWEHNNSANTLEYILEVWFIEYCQTYGNTTKYKKDAPNLGINLAYRFCLQHGLDQYSLMLTHLKVAPVNWYYLCGRYVATIGGHFCFFGTLLLLGMGLWKIFN